MSESLIPLYSYCSSFTPIVRLHRNLFLHHILHFHEIPLSPFKTYHGLFFYSSVNQNASVEDTLSPNHERYI